MVMLVGVLRLVPCAVSAGVYAPLIVAEPGVLGAVKAAEHEALPVDTWVSWQGEPENVPETPVSEKLTAPAGVRGEPEAEVSVTVAVHVEAWFTRTGVAQTMVVVVALKLTEIEKPGLGLEL